jgi:small subunit ribosomal protein S20
MPHHKSAKKRLRQNLKRRLRNRYYAKSTRTAIKKLRRMHDSHAALETYPQVQSMIDKLVRRGIIHKNKAARLKSRLMQHINKQLQKHHEEVEA